MSATRKMAQVRRNWRNRKRRELNKKTGKPSSMLNLLTGDARHTNSDHVEVAYEQQFRTFFKAQRLGYIDEDGNITEKGKQFTGEKGA